MINSDSILESSLGGTSFNFTQRKDKSGIVCFEMDENEERAFSFTDDKNANEIQFSAKGLDIEWYYGSGQQRKVATEIPIFLAALERREVKKVQYKILGIFDVSRFELRNSNEAIKYLKPPIIVRILGKEVRVEDIT